MTQNRIPLKARYILFFATLFILAISYSEEQLSDSTDDSLYPFSPQSWVTKDNNLSLLLDSRPEKLNTYQVQLTRLYRAVMELEDRRVLELSPEMAAYYTGSKVEAVDGQRPYLVRGVSDNPGVGKITGAWLKEKNELVIIFYSLGEGGKWFNFVPLVTYLPEKPKKVWVVVSGVL